MDYNDTSYYRANPYHRQGYLMDGALKNRILSHRLGQIPQGQKYFPTTSKKLFTNIKEKSEISEQKLLRLPEFLYNQSHQRLKYQRNLSTKDIEGAIANTLKSHAIKVRQKSSNKQYSKPYLQSPQLKKQQQKYSRNYYEQNQELFNLVSRKNINNPLKKVQSQQKIILNQNEKKVQKYQNKPNNIQSYKSIDLYQLKDNKQIKSSVNLSIKKQIPKLNYIVQPIQPSINKETIQKQIIQKQDNIISNQYNSHDFQQKNNSKSFRYSSDPKQKMKNKEENRKVKMTPTFLSYNSVNLLNLAGRNAINS